MDIFIFHRDFRILDNIGLNAFDKIKSNNKMLIFFLTKTQTEENKLFNHHAYNFMMNALLELCKQISVNIIRCDSEIEGIKLLNKKAKINSIHTNKDISPFSIERSNITKKWAEEQSIAYFEYQDYLLFKPNKILKPNKDFYKIFTPFWNNIIKNYASKIRTPNTKKLNSIYNIIDRNYLFHNLKMTLKKPYAPYKREDIIKNIINLDIDYKEKRDFLDTNSTTLASAAIKYGVISIREIIYFSKKTFNNKFNNPLIRQIMWREFYYHLYYHLNTKTNWKFGDNQKTIFNQMKWNQNNDLFSKWCNGETGFDIIDAAMNQLNTTGYMHNRARLIVGSFLTKNLLMDWRLGEKYFAIKLEDYDPIVNQFSWQWIAGSGSDAAPFYRIFNPEIQQKKFDSENIYVNKYLKTSSLKILDLKESRDEALNIYKILMKKKNI